MKVGIMSMQRVINYGSFMQSYSLKKNLEAMGAEVSMVDYHVGEPLITKAANGSKYDIHTMVKKVRDNLAFVKKNDQATMNRFWKEHHDMEESFTKNILPKLEVPAEPNYNPELDLLVIGSDEVFNCLQPNPEVGYSKELYGYDNNADKLISYAASFGNTFEDGLKKYGIYGEIKEMLGKFDCVSVRDENSLNIVKGMGVTNYCKNVDPVFLYDYEKETDIEIPIRDYIVVYAYPYRITRKESAAIVRFAKKHNKKIVCLEGFQRFLGGFVPTDNPFEVYAYFKNADYIITDTFHGSVFSIKNNKQFVSLVRGGTEGSYGNNAKMDDLLKTFGLEDRKLTDVSALDKKILSPINYEKVNGKIKIEKSRSLEYLSNYVMS